MKQIIYFSDIPWRDITQRQHHLCHNLADHTRVIYFACNSIRQLKRNFAKNYREPLEKKTNLKRVELFLLPFTRVWIIRQLNFRIAFIFLFIYLFFSKNKTELILTHPSQLIFLKLPVKAIYYDYIDEAAEFLSVRNQAQKLKNCEKQILDKCTGILASSQTFKKQLISAGYKNISLIPNGVNLEHFIPGKEYKVPDELVTLKTPFIGFYGAISDWLDYDLIGYLAEKEPELNIIMIGPVSVNPDNLRKFSNIHFLGPRLYTELPAYLAAISTWIIPFKQNDFTAKINPVKAYEYLAAGRNVISTYLPELEPLTGFIKLCRTKEEFREKVKEAVKNSNNINNFENINTLLKNNSWQNVAKKLAKLMEV